MRGKLTRIGLSIILLTASMIGIISAQYLFLLENNVNSEAWINTNQDVVFNSSLGAWVLNSTDGEPPTYENFLSWEEQSGGYLTQTASRSTWTNWDRIDEGYLYNDSHPSVGGDYTAFFDLRLISIESTSGGTNLMYPFFVCANSYVGYNSQRDYRFANEETYAVRVASDLSQGSKYYLTLVETENGAQYSSEHIVDLDVGTIYYLNFTKNGADIELRVYEDSEYSVLFGSLSHTMQTENNALDSVMVPIAHGASSGPRTSSGYVENLTFDEPGGGYALEGYLYSEDLLTNTTMGPAHTFYSGQTIPEGANLNVAFSEDNSSWIRETTLSTVTGNLKESIYLDDLNYTTLYIRYHFEGPGGVTPSLDSMSIAYRIDEPEGNAKGWIYLGGVVSFIIGLMILKRPA